MTGKVVPHPAAAGRDGGPAPRPDRVALRGLVEHITFHNQASGYTIARLQPEGQSEPVTIVGAMAVSPGETVQVEGSWVTHPRFGRQVEVDSCLPTYPLTAEGIERYLGSGLIKGIGPVMARRIVSRFGAATLEVIDAQPRRLLEVAGLGRKRAEAITGAWKQQRQVRDTMVFLQSHGVGTGNALRIYQQYGQDAIQQVRQDPYRLQRDVHGIGFLTADRIAGDLGVARDAPARLRAGVRYLMDQFADEGHVFASGALIAESVSRLLQVEPGRVVEALEELCREGDLVVEGERHFLPALHRAEEGVARSLVRLLRASGPALGPWAAGADRSLGADQQRALEAVEAGKVLVITGGPGTGKTTVTRQIAGRLEAGGLRVRLASPTGRAAKRLAEATGREARTLHRLLEFSPGEGRFRRHQGNPLDADALIVDEGSMIDVSLMHALLRAVPDRARFILVGDVDQLPSVGPGYVMGDVVRSGVAPVVRLSHIYRQAGGSLIVANAHRVNQGQWPQIETRKDADFFFVEEEDPQRVAERLEDLVVRRLPQGRGLDPLRQVQVLTPMYRGDTGAVALNRRLQERLNPGKPAHVAGGHELREGDRVMQVRNNYDKGVFNGDLGRIRRLDGEGQIAEVVFDDGGLQSYDFGELDQLNLAYAISIHRAQGSEFPAVVLPLTTQHFPMLQRNLLYTALTRARELLVLIGSRRALRRAIDNNRQAERNTALAERLRSEAGPAPATASGA